MKPLYTAVATATGGRDGRATTDDARIDVQLSMPKDLGGSGGPGTNPEQLFAAGYAACFESALRLVARLQKKALSSVSITARVTIGQTDDKAFRLAAELHGDVQGLPQEEAAALMASAHQVCPYSAATRGNMEVKLFANGVAVG